MEELQKKFYDCLQELESIGIIWERSVNIDISLSKRNNKRYGCCKTEEPDESTKYIVKLRGRKYIHYKKYFKYHIEISPWVMELDEKIIKNTIMHELIHCLPECDNHGEKFKKYSIYINEKLGYNITRLGNKEEDYQKSNKYFNEENLYKYKIQCLKCRQTFFRKRYNRNFTRRYRCGKCNGKFVWSNI